MRTDGQGAFMADDFPLLDLESAWQDAHAMLQEVIDRANRLWHESDYTWLDMLIIRHRATAACTALGTLPPTVLRNIAKDRADLDELEAKADAASR
jgi:hypothetical protein